MKDMTRGQITLGALFSIFAEKVEIFSKKWKNIFFFTFLKKIPKNEKNRKKCFLHFRGTDFTVLLSYQPARSDNHASLKKILKKKFLKKMKIFEISIFDDVIMQFQEKN